MFIQNKCPNRGLQQRCPSNQLMSTNAGSCERGGLIQLGTENRRERERTAYYRPHQPTRAGDQHPKSVHSLQPGLRRGWGALRPPGILSAWMLHCIFRLRHRWGGGGDEAAATTARKRHLIRKCVGKCVHIYAHIYLPALMPACLPCNTMGLLNGDEWHGPAWASLEMIYKAACCTGGSGLIADLSCLELDK